MTGGLLLIAAALCLTGFNLADGWRAARESERILAQMEQSQAELRSVISEPSQEEGLPEVLAVIPVDGNDYMGVLELPDQGLTLPVMADWSYPRLRLAPCRYKGSAPQGSLIIAGHNYDRHFGRLKTLVPGEPVIFTDVEGRRYEYQVEQVETLESTAIEEMEAGDWDLTLFTCTLGGQSRVTVRCQTQKEEPSLAETGLVK